MPTSHVLHKLLIIQAFHEGRTRGAGVTVKYFDAKPCGTGQESLNPMICRKNIRNNPDASGYPYCCFSDRCVRTLLVERDVELPWRADRGFWPCAYLVTWMLWLARLPAASVAVARSVWVPLLTLAVFHV